jgi:hypothetical protein
LSKTLLKPSKSYKLLVHNKCGSGKPAKNKVVLENRLKHFTFGQKTHQKKKARGKIREKHNTILNLAVVSTKLISE